MTIKNFGPFYKISFDLTINSKNSGQSSIISFQRSDGIAIFQVAVNSEGFLVFQAGSKVKSSLISHAEPNKLYRIMIEWDQDDQKQVRENIMFFKTIFIESINLSIGAFNGEN